MGPGELLPSSASPAAPGDVAALSKLLVLPILPRWWSALGVAGAIRTTADDWAPASPQHACQCPGVCLWFPSRCCPAIRFASFSLSLTFLPLLGAASSFDSCCRIRLAELASRHRATLRPLLLIPFPHNPPRLTFHTHKGSKRHAHTDIRIHRPNRDHLQHVLPISSLNHRPHLQHRSPFLVKELCCCCRAQLVLRPPRLLLSLHSAFSSCINSTLHSPAVVRACVGRPSSRSTFPRSLLVVARPHVIR